MVHHYTLLPFFLDKAQAYTQAQTDCPVVGRPRPSERAQGFREGAGHRKKRRRVGLLGSLDLEKAAGLGLGLGTGADRVPSWAASA